MHLWRPPVAYLAFLVVILLASCSSSSGDAAITALTPTDASDAKIESTAEVEIEVLSEALIEPEVPEVPGAPVNRFDLQVGECFNEGNWFDEELDRRIDLTALIDCDEPHQGEVYFEAVFPAPASAQFPGDEALTAWSTQLCYDAFEPFVGLEYELSTYEIGNVQPTRETFDHPVGLHRRVFCFVSDVAGVDIVGTAQGSGA